MILKVGNKKVDYFNHVMVSLNFDTIGSIFSFSFQFDPDNPDHREICRPCTYHKVTIEDNEEILLTGVMLSVTFIDSALPGMVGVTGYSTTGVLEDCQPPLSVYPLQGKNINLQEMTERILKPFGIKLIVDPAVAKRANSSYSNTTGGDSQSVRDYLVELAAQRQIILTHDNMGNLVLTEAKANATSFYDFDEGTDGVEYSLVVDGQRLHSEITIHRHGTKKIAGVSDTAKNPYITSFRPRVERQTSKDDLNTTYAAKYLVANELRAIVLTIEIDSWTLGGKIVRPNTIITVENPYIYQYQRTAWFVEGVEFQGDEKSQTATIRCVRPEVYNYKTPKNIF